VYIIVFCPENASNDTVTGPNWNAGTDTKDTYRTPARIPVFEWVLYQEHTFTDKRQNTLNRRQIRFLPLAATWLFQKKVNFFFPLHFLNTHNLGIPQQAKPLDKRCTTRFHCLPKVHKVNRHKHECAIYGADPVRHVLGCHKCTPRISSGDTQQTTPGKLTYQTLDCIKRYSPGAITCTIWKLNHIKLTNMCPCGSRSGSATCTWYPKRKPILGTYSDRGFEDFLLLINIFHINPNSRVLVHTTWTSPHS